MAIEAAFNVFGAIGMILAPDYVLSLMVSSPSQITPLAVSLTQWLAAVVLALTAPLVLCLPNTRRAVESRATTYWTLGVGEGFLVPMFLWQMGKGEEGSGFTKQALVASAVQLGGLVGWRLYVLLGRPEWLGRYRDVKKGE
ncbi:hypothetical protein MMC30_008034 [Trapelia coarctata]|nr:hypothetical protein [Trapelia coarctata]